MNDKTLPALAPRTNVTPRPSGSGGLAPRGLRDLKDSLALTKSREDASSSEQDEIAALKRRAEQGDAEAQFRLGLKYHLGRGVPQSDEEAVKWYRLAAEQGHARAQLNLGVMCANGRGTPQSDEEAVKWYRLAAEQGNARAQFNLGVTYANGRGVPQSDEEAVKWYRLAAEQGDAYAQFNLGVMCANGQGVPQSDEEAVKWYRLAAEQGATEQRVADGSVTGAKSAATPPPAHSTASAPGIKSSLNPAAAWPFPTGSRPI